ncbi:unnamed protein product [Effrenium voratum]|nr:unnamed protein product [Effrenium voratum]
MARYVWLLAGLSVALTAEIHPLDARTCRHARIPDGLQFGAKLLIPQQQLPICAPDSSRC